MAPLSTRSPPENKLAPCASSARYLRSAPLAPLMQPGKRQWHYRSGTDRFQPGYRANKEKDHGLRRAFSKAPTAKKTHAASTFKKSLLRLTGKQQAEYSLPHENPYMRACACWRQNSNIGRLAPLAGRGRPALHNTHYTPGAGGDIRLQKVRSAARAYTGYRVV